VTFGLLDLPAPLFDWIDSALQIVLPALVRLVLYATLCAWAMMYVYLRFSDQATLADTRAEVIRTRRALTEHEGSFADLNALVRRNLHSSLRQLGLTLWPALIASLPMLIVLPWLSNRFDLETPAAGTLVQVCAHPSAAQAMLHWQNATARYSGEPGCWQLPWPTADAPIVLRDANGTALCAISASTKSDIVHKFTLYNWLIANPGGYLLDSAQFDRISMTLPTREIVHVGPVWLRGWEPWFFATLFLASIAFKLRWRVL